MAKIRGNAANQLVNGQRRSADTVKVIHIEFEDHGQDFLVWGIELIGETLGKVISCEPFQGSIWEGQYVLNMNQLKPGNLVSVSKSPVHEVIEIKYPLLSVGAPVDKEPSEFDHQCYTIQVPIKKEVSNG